MESKKWMIRCFVCKKSNVLIMFATFQFVSRSFDLNAVEKRKRVFILRTICSKCKYELFLKVSMNEQLHVSAKNPALQSRLVHQFK